MTHEQIQEIEQDLEKISPWPWNSDRANHICDASAHCIVWYDHIQQDDGGYNSDFIAKSPERIKALLDEIKSLRDIIEKYKNFNKILWNQFWSELENKKDSQ